MSNTTQMNRMENRRKVALFVISAASVITFWSAGAYIGASSIPPIYEVAQLSFTTATTTDHTGNTGLYHLGITLLRVVVIICITLIGSLLIGVLMGTRMEFEAPVANILPVWMAMPGLVVILFTLVLLGFSNLSIIISVTFLSMPYGALNIWKGIQSIDNNLLEMATVFEFDNWSMWRSIYVPAIMPFLFASSRYLLAMIWKITLTAEVFGAQTGIGAMTRFWFSQGAITEVLAYFGLFLTAIFAIEYGVLRHMERRTFRYRKSVAS